MTYITSVTCNLTFSPEKYGTQLVTSVTSLIFSKESERDLVTVVSSVTSVTCVTSAKLLLFFLKRVKEKEREEQERDRRKRKRNEKEERKRERGKRNCHGG